VGQFVAVGDPIVPLQSLDSLFVNISLPQSTLSRIAVRQKVVVTLDAFSGRLFEGMITALNTQADPVTRTISVQATIPNSDSLLRPGMFARVEIESGAEEAVLVVPLSAIAYAPYGDTVYVLEKMQDEKGVDYLGARQQIVALGTRRGDLVVVKSGLKVGEQIATSGVFKLRPRVGVLVNNQVQPSAQVNPQPEDQ
jgi:membrane fusion protein (multidrug efflux system)